jgi:hypothetical protein
MELVSKSFFSHWKFVVFGGQALWKILFKSPSISAIFSPCMPLHEQIGL